MDSPTSLFDLASSPEDSISYLNDGSESLFADDDTHGTTTTELDLQSLSDDPLLDGSVAAADCSTSEILPAIGKKSRVKRLDDPGTCNNPDTTPRTGVNRPSGGRGGGGDFENPKVGELMKLLNDPNFLSMIIRSRVNPDWNQYCFLFTDGLLPWGVCSSGKPEDKQMLSLSMNVLGRDFDVYNLDHCTLGKMLSYNKPSIFHFPPAL